MNKCTAQYDVRSPHTTRLLRYARLLCGPLKFEVGFGGVPEARSRMRALNWARAGIKIAQLNDSSRSPSNLFSMFLISNVFCYGHKQNLSIYYNIWLINITIKHIAINTGRLWRRPILGQSEIVCTVTILAVQGDTACVASARWRAGERSRSGAVRSVARRARSHCWTHLRSAFAFHFRLWCILVRKWLDIWKAVYLRYEIECSDIPEKCDFLL